MARRDEEEAVVTHGRTAELSGSAEVPEQRLEEPDRGSLRDARRARLPAKDERAPPALEARDPEAVDGEETAELRRHPLGARPSRCAERAPDGRSELPRQIVSGALGLEEPREDGLGEDEDARPRACLHRSNAQLELDEAFGVVPFHRGCSHLGHLTNSDPGAHAPRRVSMYASGNSPVKSLMNPPLPARHFHRVLLRLALVGLASLTLPSPPLSAQPPGSPAPMNGAPVDEANESASTDEPTEIPRGTTLIPGLDNFADLLAELTTRRWNGQRVPAPETAERPELPYSEPSRLAPLRVHGEDPARVAQAREVLEDFAGFLEGGHWPRPYADGGRGGDDGFDLYLVPEGALATSAADGRMLYSYLDAVTAFGRVDPSVGDLASCAAQAYADALLYEQDPAESARWRRATAAWLAWRFTGRFCAAGVDAQQREPERSWISNATDEGGGGALLLALLSEQFDGGDTSFVRELWQLARQRTWEGDGLRGSPDLWEALHAVVDHSRARLSDLVEELAVRRFELGARREHSRVPALVVDDRATVPVFETIAREELPEHGVDGPRLDPYGSGYSRVGVAGAAPGSRLRVWLRGEWGVAWSLTAVRRDAAGRDLGRVQAPPRPADRRSYLPIELTPDTSEVLVVVTNLSHRLPDADTLDLNTRSFRLIYELVHD